ncbi:MAG: 4Fe-4S dicluster domain-containing protein, partial [Roseiflexaceae bacterium]|nr:4Fe-4S dicluster domain-containing protein [Roseiflexaceae bacterium]
DVADRRRVRKENHTSNRLYVAEPTPTPTGSLADHRLPVRASAIESLTRAIAQGLSTAGVAAGAALSEKESKWAAAVAKDLLANKGKSIVVVGDGQPSSVHALANVINQTLGNVGTTVTYVEPVDANPSIQFESIKALTDEMRAGQVKVLLLLGGNPIYNAPADLDFAGALGQVPLSIHQSLYVDETSSVASWHINATHYLEEWGDARAHDGTVTIIQPLIAPLYDGKSASDVIHALLGTPDAAGYVALTNFWRGQAASGDFDKAWFQILHDGFAKSNATKPVSVSVSTDFAAQAPAAPAQDIEIVFRPDPSIGDGFYANNGWLQELPKPITKVTWDNAAYMSPATAKELGVTSSDLVELNYGGKIVNAAALVVPGHAEKSVVVHLGYGRTKAGRTAAAAGGFNAYSLRTTAAPYFGGGLQVRKLGQRYELALTQLHFALEGRKDDIVPTGTLEEFIKNEEFLHKEEHHEVISLFPAYEYKSYAWGLSIDLNVCTGCNVCTVACQAENNIAIVGKDEVSKGRELQWIRLDQYFAGDENDPQIYTQPMMCQHCENAPCEIVCPVGATSHDSEGLNVMTYNRCVGTKYCSNNCPYKVRRFNFLQYSDETTKSLKLGRNPDVTVRSRGVMEKCTYCVQRISEARIEAEKADRTIQDNEIVTACQQACPTQAIVFGNINDANAQVTKLKAEPLTFTVLEKLNNRPRTSYMARLRNVNPELGGAEQKTE